MIKHHSIFPLTIVLLLFYNTALFSQNTFGNEGPVFHGIDLGAADQMTPLQHERIRAAVDSASKAINLFKDITKDVLFALPIKLKNGVTDYGFYTITGYVDHDLSYPDNLLDYNCGNLTYDVSDGYNHKGTDFYCWPFSWLRMQNNEVEIIAAAQGTIIYKSDGYFDQNCSMNSDTWNAVYVQHADGSIAWYGHMKKNSLTSKIVGETVTEGEYLGAMGSSGSSTGPHLHFEIYNSLSALIDPFQGTCNDFNSNTWWQNQIPYKDAAINRFQTCNHTPVMPACPGVETPNETDYFYTGDTLFVVSWLRNFSTGDGVDITVYRPNGSVYYNTTFTSPWPFYQAAWLYYYFILDAGDPSGLWHAEASYKGQLYTKQFYYNVGVGISEISDQEFSVTQDENNIYIALTNIQNPTAKIIWSLYDLRGSILKTGSFSLEKEFIPISQYPEGVYLFVAISDKSHSVCKIIR